MAADMSAASSGIRKVLAALEATEKVEDALLQYVAELEANYLESEDITLFIFAVRSFFCWHRAPELAADVTAVAAVRDAWLKQNDCVYSNWLASAVDDPKILRWAKWTFQAKNSILDEFLIEQKRAAAAGGQKS